MCHVPIIYETLESAIEKGKDVLNHIHLGNAVVKDPTNELYGDRHPSWSYPCGEYTEEDAIRFIRMLNDVGYLDKDGSTVSFEMRPYVGKTPDESLEKFVSIWEKAIKSL